MRLQWCTGRRSACSYSRVCHVLFLDLDDCALLGLFGLAACVSNCHDDLYTTANRKMESLRQWKAAQHEARSQENFLLSIQSTARPKSRILFKHGPDLSLDLVVYRGVEDDRPTQEIRASGWKISTNCALNVPRPDALCSRKSRGQDSVALPVRRGSRRERSTKKESHKIVALAFGCGKRPKLHLPREVSKPIRGL